MTRRLWGAAAALSLLVACARHSGPLIDTGNAPEGVGGTIAGRVSATTDSATLVGRKVTAINEATGARFEVSTASNGGYTLKVPAGTYRLEVELRAGESVQTQPPATEVNVGDLDPDRNFVLTVR